MPPVEQMKTLTWSWVLFIYLRNLISAIVVATVMHLYFHTFKLQGLRLRYEFAREFAPYIGISQEWRIGDSADFARAEGEDPSVTNYVVGLRFWF